MAYRAESDDITTDERLSNFETRLMWFMLNRMEFGNVLHMKQVRMAKALKVPPSQVSRALKSSKPLAGSPAPIKGRTPSVLSLAGAGPKWNVSKSSGKAPIDAKSLVRELARGLEPLTCCLQDSCATDCATPA